MIDKIDKDLLRELQTDSKIRTYQLSKKLNVPATTIHNRIKRLEKEGFIKGYKAVVDSLKLDKPLTVLIALILGEGISSRDTAEKIKKIRQVEDIYIITGPFDIIVKVRLKDTNELATLIFDIDKGFRGVHGVMRTESLIVLHTIKENGITSVD